MNGYSLTLIPLSWCLGKLNVRNKTLWAFGPFRFVLHRGLSNQYG